MFSIENSEIHVSLLFSPNSATQRRNYTPGVTKEVSKRRTSYIKELYYFEANQTIVTCSVQPPQYRLSNSTRSVFESVS